MGRERGGDTKEIEVQTTDDPPGTNRYLGAGRGWQEGANGCRTRRQKQAHVVGRRDERKRLADGGWGRIPGGQRTTPGEYLGSR